MTYPRAHLVDQHNGGFYHCISRCVRRAWLCGKDPLTKRSYEHRRAWLESRLVGLAQLFALDLYAYAVMSNHYHLVVRIEPRRALLWSDEEVVQRWLRLGPACTEAETAQARTAVLGNPERVLELRRRLGSLSWFMRYLNEPIARRANAEDECSGRFWEGRFKSHALLNETAAVACLAYVDLNPVRAGESRCVKQAPYTSMRRRVAEAGTAAPSLAPLQDLGLTLSTYTELLSLTASLEHGSPPPAATDAPSVLRTMKRSVQAWLAQVRAHRRKYRAYGTESELRCYAQMLGQKWLRGLGDRAVTGA